MRSSAASTRLVAWLALACHLLVASGAPLPMAVPAADPARAPLTHSAKDRSRPFPCMDKPCGCATAEQCFAGCCCHTPAERLAWARAQRVESAVLAALERRVAAAARPAADCCAARREPSCCAAEADAAVDPAAPEVPSDDRPLAADAPEPAPADASPVPPSPRIVILRDVLACGGILTVWLACGAALPPPRAVPPAQDEPAGFLALGDDLAPSVAASPSAPPPRLA